MNRMMYAMGLALACTAAVMVGVGGDARGAAPGAGAAGAVPGTPGAPGAGRAGRGGGRLARVYAANQAETLPKPQTKPAEWLVEHDPVTPNASPEAKALLKYLYSISLSHTLTGQHNFAAQQEISTNAAMRNYGKTPALYGTDWGFSAQGDKDSAFVRDDTVKELTKQWQSGHVIVVCWHAVRPTEDEPVTFGQSVQGMLTDAEWDELMTPGSKLNDRWLAQVDNIAGYLKKLEAAHVPILWRPFHEMNLDAFWWSGRRGDKGTKVLYQMIFDRLVGYHKLTNLVWIWNCDQPNGNDRQFVDYFPGQKYFDLLSLDCYGTFQQRFYDEMNALSDGKPMAISETGGIPPLDIYVAQPKWTFYMVWAGMGPGGGGGGRGGRGGFGAGAAGRGVDAGAGPGAIAGGPGAGAGAPGAGRAGGLGAGGRGGGVDARTAAQYPRLFSWDDDAYWQSLVPLRKAAGLSIERPAVAPATTIPAGGG